MEPSPQHPVVTRESRERTIRLLCAHFTHDNLATEEFERRLELAYRAQERAELAALVSDLPALPGGATREGALTPAPVERGSLAAADEVSEQRVIVAVMGGAECRGQWTPARRNFVIAFMGGAELDFRSARLGPGTTEVTIFAMMGGVEITVPPGMAVESHGVAIMGGFAHTARAAADHDPEAPRLRINGFALMGGVEIDVRLPGESKRDSRHRLREEHRQLREERRRLR